MNRFTKAIKTLFGRENEGPISIQFAAYNGNLAVLNSYIQEGYDLNELDTEESASALHWAASMGHADCVKTLLEAGADPLIYDLKYGFTVLNLAVLKNAPHIVEFLIDNGAKLNAFNQYGFTPLLLAAEEGHTHIIDLLVTKGD